MGIASSVRSHSPLKALISQLLSPVAKSASSKHEADPWRTIVNHPVRIVKENAVVRIRENMHVIILHARKVESIQESQGILHVNVVVCYAVHHQETDIALESGHVADGGILVAFRVILRRLHVSFGIDRVWQPKSVMLRPQQIHRSVP